MNQSVLYEHLGMRIVELSPTKIVVSAARKWQNLLLFAILLPLGTILQSLLILLLYDVLTREPIFLTPSTMFVLAILFMFIAAMQLGVLATISTAVYCILSTIVRRTFSFDFASNTCAFRWAPGLGYRFSIGSIESIALCSCTDNGWRTGFVCFQIRGHRRLLRIQSISRRKNSDSQTITDVKPVGEALAHLLGLPIVDVGPVTLWQLSFF